jgi:hypothetical protein
MAGEQIVWNMKKSATKAISLICQLTVLTVITTTISGCRQPARQTCMLPSGVNAPQEIAFPDTLIRQKAMKMCFSPFSDNKIWINTANYYKWELDLKNISFRKVDNRLNGYFSDGNNSPFSFYDKYDSVFWLTSPWFMKYDDKSGKLDVIRDVYGFTSSPLLITPQNIFFERNDTVFSFNNRSYLSVPVKQLIDKRIKAISIPDDSTLLLDDKLLYNVYTGTIIKQRNIPAKHEIAKDSVEWRVNNKYAIERNTNTGKEVSHFIRFPFSDSGNLRFIVKNGYLWFNPHPYVLRLADDSVFTYKELNKDSVIHILVDECFLYRLTGKSLVINTLKDIQAQMKPFDTKGFDIETTGYLQTLYQLSHRHDTSIMMVQNTIAEAKSLFKGCSNVEVLAELQRFEDQRYYCLHPDFPNGLVNYAKNTTIPYEYRRSCFNRLLREAARKGQFKKVVEYYNDLSPMFKPPDGNVDYTIIDINKLKTYISRIDSLNNAGMTEDSCEYYKALVLHDICMTYWFEGECINDFSFYKSALQRFIKKYPSSRFVDNAEFKYEQIYWAGWFEEGCPDEKHAWEIINSYRTVLKKYPDSEIISEIEYEILYIEFWCTEISNKKMDKLLDDYLQKFPQSQYASKVQSMKEYFYNRLEIRK